MASENEKLRALLAEVREWLGLGCGSANCDEGTCALRARIDAALAEPVAECARCETLRGLADTAAAEQGLAQRRMMEAQRERDEARAEVMREAPTKNPAKPRGKKMTLDMPRGWNRYNANEGD